MTDHTDERDRLIDSLLEEAVGGWRVPDLAARILALAGVTDREPAVGASGAARLFSRAKTSPNLERLKNMKRTATCASAAAVAVAIAAGFVGFFFGPGSGNAFADVRKEFDCAKTPLGERVVDDKKAKGLGGTYRRDGQDYEVETWVDAKTGALDCIVLANPEGKVRMVMDRFILNPELPDSLFSLEPPKGYDVERRDAP